MGEPVRYTLGPCRIVLAVIVGVCAATVAGCDDDGEAEASGAVVVGALYFDDSNLNGSLVAVQLAAEDLNASGVFDRRIEIAPSLFTGDSDREALARALFDDGAVAITSEFSSTAKTVLQLTNDTAGPYADRVQCSGSATSSTINRPDTPDEEGVAFASDKNDTLYRTVADDITHAGLLWQVVADRSKLGVYHADDAFGRSFRDAVAGLAAGEGIDLVVDRSWSSDTFTVAAAQAVTDEILAANDAGTLDTLILVGFGEVGDIMRLLIEAQTPFTGTIVTPEQAGGFFNSQVGGFTAWMEREDTRVVSTVAENHEGAHSAAWFERLQAAESRITRSGSNFYPSQADCLYSLGLAMLLGEGETRYAPASIKAKMLELKASAHAGASDVLLVSPNADGFRAAADAIAAGRRVKLDGASGVVEFDDNGDRATQLYALRQPERFEGGWAWSTVSVHDSTSGECVTGCE